MFALLGLLLAFSFSGAATRFELRPQLLVDEANTIGTAYLRLELLTPNDRVPLQAFFRKYVDTRIAAYQRLPDIEAALAGVAEAEILQQEIWHRAVAATRAEGYQPAAMLLLPALNDMIDITTTRTMAAKSHPPTIIFLMLGVLLLIGALLAGFGTADSRHRSWLHILSFTAISAITLFVILDLEYPRAGLIRIDAFDQVLSDVRQGMN